MVKLRKFDQVNVIPFIDIMLVLLVIVLTTATFIVQGKIKLVLPDAKSTQNSGEKEVVEIAINADGKLFYQEEAISLDMLQSKLETLEKSKPVVIKADQETAFQRFVDVIDLLKAAKLENVAIATNKPKEP